MHTLVKTGEIVKTKFANIIMLVLKVVKIINVVIFILWFLRYPIKICKKKIWIFNTGTEGIIRIKDTKVFASRDTKLKTNLRQDTITTKDTKEELRNSKVQKKIVNLILRTLIFSNNNHFYLHINSRWRKTDRKYFKMYEC